MRKRAIFIVMAILLPLVSMGAALTAVEYRYHGPEREGLFGYVNLHGYRGPVRSRKRPGEFRVVVAGGSTVYGQGVDANSAFPAALERDLRRGGRDVSVVNLGFMNDGAYATGLTLRDYRYLDYDLAILYDGYNDLINGPNLYSFRHRSLVFRLTGYLPMFPLVFEEKAKSLRSRGDLGAAYRGDRPVVPIGVAARASAAALEFAASLDKRMSESMRETGRVLEGACGYWTFFCEHAAANVRTALDAGADALVVVQPYLPANDDPLTGPVKAVLHRGQTARMLSYLRDRFRGDARVHISDLGDVIDLRRTTYRFEMTDKMHLNGEGNAVVAQHLVDPVVNIAAGRAARSSHAAVTP